MKKAMLIVLVLACLALCACSREAKKADIPEAGALAAELLSSGAFTEELGEIGADVGGFLYGLEESDAPGMRFWCSSGAVSEEIAFFPCRDAAAAEKVLGECRARIEQQSRLFADYRAEEVPKLEKALVLQRENTVVLCVAADAEKAAAVLDKYF